MTLLLRVILCLTGLALALIGLNTALGGMATLGWQFPAAAVPPGEGDWLRHDSNARFFGGVFTGLGLVIAAGGLQMRAMAPAVTGALLAIALGGLFRLAQPGYSPLSDMALLPSLIAEVILAPILALWVRQTARRPE